ncbi:MAG: hypothetical protein IJW18_03385 [Lachnospiraceae bacterium]|nr:hypothetical protein [Lachnospiraceae bacterium]
MDDKKVRNDKLIKAIYAKRPPIVVLDTRWHELFAGIEKPRRVRELEEEVNTLLKRQGQINFDIDDLKKLKAKLVKSVVNNMETSTSNTELNKKRNKILEKDQQFILECNDKISKLEEEKFEIPDKLRYANAALIAAGMEVVYRELEIGKREFKEVSDWIEEARAELRTQLLVKQDLEERNTMLYTNMHAILGAELSETFDNTFEQKE